MQELRNQHARSFVKNQFYTISYAKNIERVCTRRVARALSQRLYARGTDGNRPIDLLASLCTEDAAKRAEGPQRKKVSNKPQIKTTYNEPTTTQPVAMPCHSHRYCGNSVHSASPKAKTLKQETMKQQLTSEEKLFIIENRLEISMVELSRQFGKSYALVRRYMKDNQLELTKDQVQRIRVKKYKIARGIPQPSLPMDIEGDSTEPEAQESFKPPKWVPEPWSHGINLITMLRA